MNTGGYVVIGILALLAAVLVAAMWVSSTRRTRLGVDRRVADEQALRAARPHADGRGQNG
jgi:FtsZ-interacting cell division protein ZipA